MSLFLHSSLTSFPSEPCYLWIFPPIALPAVFFPLLLSLRRCLHFSPLTFSSLNCVIFSLHHFALHLSLFTSLTPSVSLTAAATQRQTLFCETRAEILNYCDLSDFHLDVFEIQLPHTHTHKHTQWIVLIFHNFRFIHWRQA